MWDTSVASQLHPGARYAKLLTAVAQSDAPIMVTASTAVEVTYGFARQVSAKPAAVRDLAWYRTLFAGPFARVLPLDAPRRSSPVRCGPATPCPPRSHAPTRG